MERAVALKRLRRILGSKACYEINPKAPSKEERAVAQAAQPAIHAERDAANKALELRLRFLLDNDPEYQRIKERVARARKALQDNGDVLLVHKITVGTDEGMFFRVEAQGDSWESVFEILKRKEVKK